jgi:hypothetical protein
MAVAGPVLKVIYPDGQERRVQFVPPEMQIGSSVDSTLVLGGNGVSGKHCRISVRGDKLVVADRGSKNGTYVNSKRCSEPTEFGPGDRLSVGAYTLEFADGVAAQKLEDKLSKFEPVALARSEDQQRAAERTRLARYAREWHEHGRARRLLLRGRDLTLAAGWMGVPAHRAEVEQDATLKAFVAASIRAYRIRLAAQLLGFGAAAATGIILLLPAKEAPKPPEPEPVRETTEVVQKTGPSKPVPKAEWIEHVVSPGETYDDIARYYEASPAQLLEWNGGAPEPVPGGKVKVLTARPPRAPLVQELHVVGEGEDWLAIANLYSTTVDKLRTFNPKLGDRLKPNDELTLWIEGGQFGTQTPNPEDLPIFIVPEGSSSGGKVTEGTLHNPVQLLPSKLASVRCASHAFATNHTVSTLLHGIAAFRSEGYNGEVMVADLSLRDGGGYGRHKSHQSGRDADLWLLPKRRQFRKGCNNCTTDSCRPEPEEVDWQTEWKFIRALHSTGQVKEIFLSHWLQKELYEAALALGESKEDLKKLIQYPRPKGMPALVMHSDGHIHHIHVRFKCDPTDTMCSEAK